MPPKTRITKELIVQTAFELTKNNGIESVTAKAVAQKLNCSIQPVYWVFDTMDNLRSAVIVEATKECERCLLTDVSGLPRYKAIYLNYIRFAKEQPYLFRTLFMMEHREILQSENNLEGRTYIISLIQEDNKICKELAEQIYIRLWLFSHGIATMLVTKAVVFSDEEIRKMLTDFFQGMLKIKEKRFE